LILYRIEDRACHASRGAVQMDYDVIIIGAGLAGLTCAVQFQKAGRSSLIIEAADAVGGRIRTDIVDGFQLDRGFQVFLTSYPTAQKVLDFSTLELKSFEPGAMIRYQNRFECLSDPWRRSWRGLRSIVNRIGTFRDKLRIAKLRRACLRGTIEQCLNTPESTTLADLKSLGFSDGMIEQFFRPFLGGIFLERDLATSNRMFRFVFRMFSIGEAALPAGGMQAIPTQLANRLPTGSIRLSTPVSHVARHRVDLANGESLKANVVVIATDAQTASAFLSKSSPPQGPSVTCFYYGCDSPPESEPYLVLNGEGSGPINSVCVPSVVAPTYAPPGQHLVSASMIGAHPDSEAAIRAQLKSWYGNAVDSWQYLKTCVISNALPSQLSPGLNPPERSVRVDHGLYCCGDHVQIASIEGAMASGIRVVDAVIADRR
jgi:phytoene dehydrogenase-like protein